MSKCLSFCIVFLTVFTYSQITTAPTITTENGEVAGHALQTLVENKTIYAYQGIPYAKAPLGSLRFKAPVKPDNWSGILNATQDGSQCIQGSNPITGSEDCLYLNVYVPQGADSNLTVMVWIHGGAFIGGNSSYHTYNPDYFLEENVIFVSFNYRLGVFGYLSTEDLECPGNWGLKDQLMALQWVQKNIQYFGGNPDKVTVFGESAGAASISYLQQSKKSVGLYRGVIMESGVSLCLWSLTRRARLVAFEIGELLKVNVKTSKNLVDNLRKIDAKKLQKASNTITIKVLLNNALAGLVHTPVIEPVHDEALFSGKSDALLRSGNFNRVPSILGINSNEASAAGDLTLLFRTYIFGRYDLNSELLAPASLNGDSIGMGLAGNLIKLRYFGILPVSLQDKNVIQFISDDQFNRPVIEAVKEQSKYAPVYFYMFSYKGIFNADNNTFKGVGHAEELPYLFQPSHFPKNDNLTNDIITKRRMVRLWANFAKFGNPTPEKEELFDNKIWPKVDLNATGLVYLNIEKNLTVERDPFNDNLNFYERVFKSFGKPPYSTY